MIKSTSQPGLKIINAPGEEDLTEVISSACSGALETVRELWGLEPLRDCRIYVMTSWRRFTFQATPWYLKPFTVTSYPFWAGRIARTWPYAGAWTQHFGKRVVIGIKPPRLLETSDKSIGELIYVKEKDMMVRMRHFICHELTHACASHLLLPAWLNEGIAMHSVDHFIGKRTIRLDSKELLRVQPSRSTPPGYRQFSRLDARGVATQVARGYWLVDLLEKTQPGFLKKMFSSGTDIREIDQAMAKLLNLPADKFWQMVDDLILK